MLPGPPLAEKMVIWRARLRRAFNSRIASQRNPTRQHTRTTQIRSGTSLPALTRAARPLLACRPQAATQKSGSPVLATRALRARRIARGLLSLADAHQSPLARSRASCPFAFNQARRCSQGISSSRERQFADHSLPIPHLSLHNRVACAGHQPGTGSLTRSCCVRARITTQSARQPHTTRLSR